MKEAFMPFGAGTRGKQTTPNSRDASLDETLLSASLYWSTPRQVRDRSRRHHILQGLSDSASCTANDRSGYGV